jgi:hypothetical protein
MKIEGRRLRIVEALKEGRVPQGVSPAEVKEALDTFSAEELSAEQRSAIEKLLAQDLPHTVEAPSGGKRLHDLRAEKRKPWWSGLAAVGTPLHPEPTRDVEVHGERVTKDDLASLLRSLARV